MNRNVLILTIILLAPLAFLPTLIAPDDCGNVFLGLMAYFTAVAAVILVGIVSKLKTVSLQNALLGGLLGLLAAFLCMPLLRTLAHYQIGIGDSIAGHAMLVSSAYFFCFIIGAFAAQAGTRPQQPAASEPVPPTVGEKKICDTSVLIDGRIAEMAEAGFLDGELVIPQFILRELQSIADSAEQLKRNRGRRGLDIVKQLQDIEGLKVSIPAVDFADEREVDHKLLKLALLENASLITNDFNLNKVAKVRSIKVLNLNDLVNALKTIYLPGEEITAIITREGKEQGQGIAYLDDGTMVVMDGAAPYVGKQVKAIVTNIHQTTAGRMIFTRFESLSGK